MGYQLVIFRFATYGQFLPIYQIFKNTRKQDSVKGTYFINNYLLLPGTAWHTVSYVKSAF